jgi:multiple sugar transport system permease protein
MASLAISTQQRAEARTGIGLAAPAAVLLFVLLLAPALATLIMSFLHYRLGTSQISFAGLTNYQALAADPMFWVSLRNTFLYVAMVVPGSVLLGLGSALLIERRSKLRAFYRAAYFLPVASTFIAMATVWEFLMNPAVGLFNQLLALLGVARINFLGDPLWALPSMALIGIWELIGFNMVMFMAGLSTIPRELYQAAAIDGADGFWSRFTMVTWPLLAPTTMFVVIMSAIRAFRVFEVAAVITNGRPEGATEVMLYSIFVQAFQYFNIGYAAALTVVFLVITATLALLQVRLFEQPGGRA